jgi:hypothetical protein
MAQVEILRNEVPDAALARRFEREIAEAAAGAGGSDERLVCAVLDEGLHAEIEVELPGWMERVQVAYPAREGDVRRAMTRLLRDLGLMDDRATIRHAGLSRDY